MPAPKQKRNYRRRGPAVFSVNTAAAREHGMTVPELHGDQAISPNEAGRILGMTGEAIKQYVYQRRLPATKQSNGYWRIRKSDLEKFIQARISGPVAKVLVFPTGTLTPLITSAVEKVHRAPTVASTFPDAVLKVVNDYPSAAIIDLSAGKDAWKLAERLKEQNFVVPILLISEKSLNDEDTDRALAVGAKAVLTGVVTMEQVAAELDSVMARCL